MSISGLVITLSRDAEQRCAVLAALHQHPAIEVGELADNRLPIVVETSGDDDRAVWDWLHTLAGVQFVDLAFLHFGDGEEPTRSHCVVPSNTTCQPTAHRTFSEKDIPT